MSLRQFNREDWAGVPFTIRLLGGPSDGQTFKTKELLPMWRVPLSPSPGLLAWDLAAYPEPVEHLIYRQTFRVADDGAHLYEYQCSGEQ